MSMTTAITAASPPAALDFPSSRAAQAGSQDSHAQNSRPAESKPADPRAGDAHPAESAHAHAHTPAGRAEHPKAEESRQRTTAAATVNPTFQIDSRSQRMVMMVHDQTTGAVVQQIPSEAALRQYEEAMKRAREEGAAESAPPEPAAPPVAAAGSVTAGAGGARYTTVV